MAQKAQDAITALRRWHQDIVDSVEAFGPDDLTKQSGSSEWSVASVLSHLGSGSEIALSTVSTGRVDFGGAQTIWGRWDAMSPEEQASNFIEHDQRLVDALEALDDETLANRRVDMGFLPAPIDLAFFLTMRLGEAGLHRWDVDVAFEPEAQVAPYVVPFILDLLPAFAGHFAKPEGAAGRIAVETFDPGRTYLLDLGDGQATLSEGAADNATTRVALPGEAFARLTSGRLHPEHTPASVVVEGELSLDDLRRIFPGY